MPERKSISNAGADPRPRERTVILTETDYEALHDLGPDPALQGELDRAVIVPPGEVPPDVVTMNSRVRYTDESSGETREVSVVYPQHADGSDGRISVLAPVGAALLGLRAGQAIDWEFPDGSRRRLRADAVLQQPERNRAGSPR